MFTDTEIENRIIEAVKEADIDSLSQIHKDITNYPPIEPEEIEITN